MSSWWTKRLQGYLDYSQNAYPRSSHATLALLQSAAGDASFAGGWQAAEGLLLAFFALLVSGAAKLAAMHMESAATPRWMSQLLAPFLVGLLMVTGSWLLGNVALGFLTTVQASLLLVSWAILLWDGSTRPSLPASVALVLLCALMAHSFILLLPMIAIPTVWITIGALRINPKAMAAALCAGSLLTLPAAYASVTLIDPDEVSNSGAHTLPMLGAIWLLILIFACVGMLQVRRLGHRPLIATCYALMVLSFLAVIMFVLPTSDGTVTGSYYLLKSAWLPIGVFLALALPAVLILIWRAKRKIGAAVSALMLSWLAITQSVGLVSVYQVLSGSAGAPAVSVPLFELLSPRAPNSPVQGKEYLVWGLMPYVSSDAASYFEWLKVETTALGTLPPAGYPAVDLDGQVILASHQDASAMCDLLRGHPDAVAITGPYPQGPLGWLSEAGCPDDVIRPERWVSVEVPPSFFQGTRWEGEPLGSSYPTLSEVHAASPSQTAKD